MSETTHRTQSETTHRDGAPRALRILAKSVFRELKSSGYSRTEMLAFATELLSLVSTDLKEEQPAEIAAEE